MLRLTTALERDLRAGLVLASESHVPLLSIWAGAFQRVLFERKVPRPVLTIQLRLWSEPDDAFHCRRYGCAITYRGCITRQVDTDSYMSDSATKHKRGKAPHFPGCYTETCGQGAAHRRRFGDGVVIGLAADRLDSADSGREGETVCR